MTSNTILRDHKNRFNYCGVQWLGDISLASLSAPGRSLIHCPSPILSLQFHHFGATRGTKLWVWWHCVTLLMGTERVAYKLLCDLGVGYMPQQKDRCIFWSGHLLPWGETPSPPLPSSSFLWTAFMPDYNKPQVLRLTRCLIREMTGRDMSSRWLQCVSWHGLGLPLHGTFPRTHPLFRPLPKRFSRNRQLVQV